MAAKIYKQKHAKGAEFGYLHVWLIVKDYPRWAEGWGTSTTVAPSRQPRVVGADQESVTGVSEEATGFEDGGDMESNAGLQVRPVGSKAAKEAHKAAKTRDGAMYVQVAAQEVLGVAATAKAAIMAEHNLILLMSAPDEGGLPTATAREFLALRQAEELKKLKLRLVQEAAQEIVQEEARIRKLREDQEAAEALERQRLETERQRQEEVEANRQGEHDGGEDWDDDEDYEDEHGLADDIEVEDDTDVGFGENLANRVPSTPP
jgi:hypothetical protein